MTEGIRKVVPEDAAYPPLLRSVKGRPDQLYLRGAGLNPNTLNIATIGSRKASKEHGRAFELFLTEFFHLFSEYSPLQLTLISGLALNIDRRGHTLALDSDIPTVGVLPTAIDRMYPKENLDVALRILAKNQTGNAIISEYEPIGETGESLRFPLERNRIIVWMSKAVIAAGIPETRSGTLQATRLAREKKRPVYFLKDTVSEPVRKILLGRQAIEVTTARQLLDHLGPSLL